MANYALRLPDSLMQYAKDLAREEHVSVNQLFLSAIAEKISALKTEAYFRQRRERGDEQVLEAWLSSRPDADPMPGDELPVGFDASKTGFVPFPARVAVVSNAQIDELRDRDGV